MSTQSIALASGICIAGKDTGDQSPCSQATSNLLQAIIETASQSGSASMTVPQVQQLMLAFSNDPVVSATMAKKYQNWLKLAGLSDSSSPVVIPTPIFTMKNPVVVNSNASQADPLAANPWGFVAGS